MFLRTALLFLALTISQVAATSALQQRSLEFLETRQTTCTSICTAFSDAISGCKTTSCICNAAVAARLQTCVTCAVTSTPTPAMFASAQQLVDTYAQTCAGVAGVPAVTVPGGTGATTTIRSTTTIPTLTTQPTTTTTPLIIRSTVTSATTPRVVVQSTISTGVDTSTDDPFPSATNALPGVFTNDGTQIYNAKQAGLVAISAMVGAALVL